MINKCYNFDIFRNEDLSCPMQLACKTALLKHKGRQMVKQLVQHGANIEFVDHALRNALYWWVLTNNKQFAHQIWFLVENCNFCKYKGIIRINKTQHLINNCHLKPCWVRVPNPKRQIVKKIAPKLDDSSKILRIKNFEIYLLQ